MLIADPNVRSAKATANALAGWGFQPLLVHDGVEALMTIQRSLPAVVVLDAALPKMVGLQVCELVKRNEQLRSIHVVLVGAVADDDRTRRAANEQYGADAYIERPQLPEALRPALREFLNDAPHSGAAVPSGAAGAPASAAAPPASAPAPAAGPNPAASPTDPDVVAAERLARIVVSDIVLYNAEKFQAGIQNGNVVEVLTAELEEGRSLFEARVDPKLRETRDFLSEELVRVARTRGMS